MIKFEQGNAKLPNRIIHMSLPSGHTCKPWAKDCLSSADRETGRITDGPDTCFRCWSASLEARVPARRKNVWNNYNQIAGCISKEEQTALLINSLMPRRQDYVNQHNQEPIVRIHVGGEFYSSRYFDAWLDVCRFFDNTKFYAYTKALPLWVKNRATLPKNLELNASRGGRFDHLIERHGFKEARVVFSEHEASKLGLRIDHDDSHAYKATGSFALLLHGTQPAGSKASKCKSALSKRGFNGYGKTSEAYVSNFS